MSSTLPHSIMVVQVCIKLHNLGVDSSITRVKPHDRDFKGHDIILVAAQSNVVGHAPRHLKSKAKSTIRDCLCDIVKEGGGVKPAENKRTRTS
jgi:hypothetical protein